MCMKLCPNIRFTQLHHLRIVRDFGPHGDVVRPHGGQKEKQPYSLLHDPSIIRHMGRYIALFFCAILAFGATLPKKHATVARKTVVPKKQLTLPERIQTLINSSEAGRGAHWGINAVALASGQSLAAINETRHFVPASNTKLFSTALAFDRLGPDYRFQTKIVADMLPDKEGRITGDLRLIGGGDPTLSGRIYPYRPKAEPNSPYAPLEDLADQLIERGVKEIQGDILGDDSRYPWDPFPEGWAVDDPIYEYGAPVSALTWNDNAFRLTLDAAPETGQAPGLTIFPSIGYFNIQNLASTGVGREKKIDVRRIPSANEIVVSGKLMANGQQLGPGGYAHFPGGTAMLHEPAAEYNCTFVLIFDGPFDLDVMESSDG